jgi:hypothetical protein
MRKTISLLLLLTFFSLLGFSQTEFSEETQKYIALGFQDKIGTIEVGKSADLLVIDGDPSKKISDLRKVQYVFKNGVGYDSRKLFESVRGKVGFN